MKYFFAILVTISISNPISNGLPVSLDQEKGIITFKNFECLPDTTGSITQEEIAAGKYDHQFKIQGEEIVYEPGQKAWWVRFKVKNSSSFDEEWVFNFQDWSFVDFYFRKDDQAYEKRRTGHLLPFRERDYQVANFSYISIVLKAGTEYQCMARLDPEFNGLIKVSNLNFQAATRRFIDDRDRDSLVISWMFIGTFIVMLLYNGFLYYTTREKEYRFYLLTIFLLLLNLLNSTGLLTSLTGFIDSMPEVLKVFNYIEPQLLGLSGILFLNDFFDVKVRYPRWYKFLKIELIFTAFVILLLLINFNIGLVLSVLNTIPVLILVFGISIKSLKDRYPSSLYFIMAHVFSFIGGIISMLVKIQAIPYSDFAYNHAFSIGSSLEMILFSIALGNRINVLKKENDKKQNQLIEQLEENQVLQTKVNRELEIKVSERVKQISEQTKEIERQKKSLQVEMDRSDRLLLNILPKEIAEELKLNGHATPKFYEQVSILFADIEGFSTMVEEITPNDLVKDLDYCFSGFDYITSRHNLEKIKTIGDAYMCVAGLPVASPNHAVDAVNAGLEMVEFINKWKDQNPVLGREGLLIRIGIHTGSVISGVVGKKKFQYDIWGNAVNLASRMESAGGPGKVNISESTYEMVKDYFDFEPRGKINIKNMGEMDMYFVNPKVPMV